MRSFSICIWRVPHPGSRAGSTPRNRNDRLPTSNVRHPLAPQSAPLHLLLLHISKTNWSKIKQTIKCRLLQRNQIATEQLCYRYFDFKKSSCTVCLMFQADFKLYRNQPFFEWWNCAVLVVLPTVSCEANLSPNLMLFAQNHDIMISWYHDGLSFSRAIISLIISGLTDLLASEVWCEIVGARVFPDRSISHRIDCFPP